MSTVIIDVFGVGATGSTSVLLRQFILIEKANKLASTHKYTCEKDNFYKQYLFLKNNT